MKVIIIGCTCAGMVAANQILKEQPATEVILYDQNAVIPSLPTDYSMFGPADFTASLPLSVPALGTDELMSAGAQIKTGSIIIGVDPKNKAVKVLDMLSDAQTVDHYDKLIIASDPRKVAPSIIETDSNNVAQFSSQQDLRVLLASSFLDNQVIVAGNDPLSLGLVEAYRQQKKDVTLILSGEPLLASYFAGEYSKRLAKILEDSHVKVMNAQIESVADNGLGITVSTDQGEITADKLAISVAIKPDTDVYQGFLKLNADGTLVTNGLLQTSDENIYVAGGSVQVKFNPTGQNIYAPTLDTAARQALIVAANITGKRVSDLGTQLSTSLSICGTTMATVGLTFEAAKIAGIDADTVMIEDNYRPEFMPTNASVLMSLVWNKDNQQILGAQLMSKHDVSQAIDLVSLCIQNKNTIEFLGMYDTMFQPNFDRTFNYINLLGQAAMVKAEQE